MGGPVPNEARRCAISSLRRLFRLRLHNKAPRVPSAISPNGTPTDVPTVPARGPFDASKDDGIAVTTSVTTAVSRDAEACSSFPIILLATVIFPGVNLRRMRVEFEQHLLSIFISQHQSPPPTSNKKSADSAKSMQTLATIFSVALQQVYEEIELDTIANIAVLRALRIAVICRGAAAAMDDCGIGCIAKARFGKAGVAGTTARRDLRVCVTWYAFRVY